MTTKLANYLFKRTLPVIITGDFIVSRHVEDEMLVDLPLLAWPEWASPIEKVDLIFAQGSMAFWRKFQFGQSLTEEERTLLLESIEKLESRCGRNKNRFANLIRDYVFSVMDKKPTCAKLEQYEALGSYEELATLVEHRRAITDAIAMPHESFDWDAWLREHFVDRTSLQQ